MRIELTALAWEARVLPLYDARSGHEGCHSKRRWRPVQTFSGCGQGPVLAGMEEQRGEIRGLGEIFDAADVDGVVAADLLRCVGDFEGGAATRKDRSTASTGLPLQAGKAVDRPGRETVRQVLLVGRQDIDGVMAGPVEGGQVVRAVVQAPEDEGRVERNGREGIDGQPDGMAIGVDGGDDGDTRGETA